MSHRRRPWLLAALVLVVLAPTGAAGQATFTGFYTLSAEASGVGIVFGDPRSSPYPTVAAQVPQTQASLSNGPTGHALASLAWPGPLVGNIGSLANLVLPLCPPVGFCSPKPDPQVVSTTNWPLRAEASSPSGQPESTLGPMRALAKGETTEAHATVADFTSPGIVSAGRVTTRSTSFLRDGTAVSLAESTVADIVLAGGTVKLSALRTFAEAVTDGARTTTKQETVVEGLEIGGHPATIDQAGVRLGSASSPNPAAAPAAVTNEQLLARFGIKLFLTGPTEATTEEGAARLHSGALAVVWTLGSSGQHVMVTLGGAAARVQATPGTSEDVVVNDFDLGSSVVFDDPSLPPFIDTAGVAPATAGGLEPAATVRRRSRSQGPPLAAAPAGFLTGASGDGFGGIEVRWALLAVLAALGGTAGLRRLHTAVVAPHPGTRCAHERRET